MAMLTAQDVMDIRFRRPATADTGYDEDEVDRFLDAIYETFVELDNKLQEAEHRVKVAEARVTELQDGAEIQAPAPDSVATTAYPELTANVPVGEQAAAVLQLAQETYDQLVARGEAESAAKINEANTKSAQIIADAEAQHNRTLAQLEQERGTVEQKISELRQYERDYRGRLNSFIQDFAEKLKGGSVEPGM